MKKILFVLLFSAMSLFAEESFSLNDLHVNLFSRTSKKPIDFSISMILEGRDVEVYDFKVIDALNIVISSFYAEDLITSQGKESFKKALKAYTTKKYSIDIDNIYIQKFSILENVTSKTIIDELNKEGYIKK